MAKKLLTLSLVAMMLCSVSLAAPGAALDLYGSYSASAKEPFSYAGEEIQSFTETVGSASARHTDVASLTPWDGATKTAITKGSGTEAAPYEIATAEELAWFADQCNTVNPALHAKLVSDINMAQEDGTKNNWRTFSFGVGITTDLPTQGFAGVLDGQGHNIYNYYWHQDANQNNRVAFVGFFKAIAGGTVKNLNFIDVDVTISSRSDYGVGYGSVVCGVMSGTGSLAENIYISGKVGVYQADSVYAMLRTYGGIVGQLRSGTVKNCYSDVEVDLTYENGTKADSGMKPIHSTGYNDSIGVGGIVGVTHHTGNPPTVNVENCGNGGKIFAPYNRRVGGVVGAIARDSDANYHSIKNLWNTGDVVGYGDVAGVCGWVRTNNYLATNLYNTGDVTAVSPVDTYASGIANHTRPTASRQSYSTGNVYLKNTGAANTNGKYDFGTVDGGFNDTMALLYATESNKAPATSTAHVYPTGADFMVNETTPKWAISYAGTEARVTDSLGTGLAPEDMEGSAILATVGEGFVADFGINGNLPILATRKNALVLNDTTYELAENKSVTVELVKSGYAALNVVNIIEGATLVVTPEGGESYTVAVTKTGIITLDTKGADKVSVAATSGNRVLITEPLSLDIAVLDAAAIKATFESDKNATIIFALFNKDELQKVQYADDSAVTDGKISAVIDLNGTNIADCVLKVYVWENDTLTPINENVETLN